MSGRIIVSAGDTSQPSVKTRFIRNNPKSLGKPALALSPEGVISPKTGLVRVNQHFVSYRDQPGTRQRGFTS